MYGSMVVGEKKKKKIQIQNERIWDYVYSYERKLSVEFFCWELRINGRIDINFIATN